ncbi:TonB-denpendent receptor [Novosphingobium barchaimii LL02]|uniref:TonB-denpendent receptor n=1 Tax=Novosphingobium barchaimii LL02 TaxID=1114963 RepID=A0A0J7XHF8_9SPHN|nr:TonB-dependent receptor [Novosphingobium barchaimii]KMS51084.1 TonB-denpendent receptor [Novosphingobium barchaimii LL02]
MKTWLKDSSRLALGAAALMASPVAFAQEGEQQGGIQEIVVTAQKKSENIQDVPISITAIGGEALAATQGTSLQALQGQIPNVQIDNFANTPQSAVFTVRGIGVIEPDPYAGNTVSIVVDGVPQFFSMGALLDLYDVDRIEVLRGPQGTLFGANTTGGVINVVTGQPTGEFGGHVKAVYGNYNRFDVTGSIEAPLVKDVLSLKVAGIHTQREGWVTNVVDGSDMGSKNLDAVRAYLRFTPGSNFDATLQGEYVNARNGSPIVINGARPGEVLYTAPGTAGMYVSPCATQGMCSAPDKYYGANNSVPDESNMDTYSGTLTMNWRNTPLGDWTSITGYKHFKLREFTDQDGTPLFLNDTYRRTEGWQLSQELRTNLELTDTLNLLVGGFYLKNHYDHIQAYRLQFAAPGLLQTNLQDQDNYSVSGFAQAYWQATDRLKLQAGIRYSHERTISTPSLITSIGDPAGSNYSGEGNTVIGSFTVGGRKSWNNVGWKLGADYEVADDALLYASWSRGFKSGGFTARVGVPADGDTPFNPENVDTFEGGIKADFLDRHLRVNLAAFYTNYRDMQVAQIYFDDTTNTQGNRILNAGKSEIKGFELETTAVPVEGMTLRGSLAYLDARYKQFLYGDPLSGAILDLEGYRLQNAPKWNASFGANFVIPLGNGADLVSDVSYTYTSSKYYTAILDTSRSKIQPTHLVDATLTYKPDGAAWSLGLWATNLLDSRYLSTVFDSPGYAGLAGYAPPRQFGASASFNF